MICLSVSATAPTGAKAASTVVGKLGIVRGGVTIERPGLGMVPDVKAGTELLVGDILTTGNNAGAQLVFQDSAYVNIAQGASMRVNHYSFERESNRRMAFIRLIRGKARVVVYNEMSGNSAVIVETDSARATANGRGDFVVKAASDITDVLALSGPVRVENISNLIVGSVSLRENYMTVVKAKEPPSLPAVVGWRKRKEYLR